LAEANANVLEATSEKVQNGAGNKVYVDFADKEGMTKAFQSVDTLFLLFPMVEQMVTYAENAVEAAKAAGVKTIVRSGGAGADSNALFKMPKVQGTIDDLIANSGIPYVITQPTSFMQNFVNFYAHNIKDSALYLPVGDGKIGWADVRDIAKVNAKVLVDPTPYLGQKLMITDPENLSHTEAIKIISEVIGKEIQFVDVPEEAANQAMKEMGMPPFAIEMTCSLNQIIKAGYAEGTTTTVQDITGESPIPFKTFVQDYKRAWV
jgi:uncharacterized protein YbjT (DUF2867 family)